MKFQNTVTLLGVVGKKGHGKLDNGEEWSTDRVELHVLSDFDSSDSMRHGQTVTVHKLEPFDEHYEKAKSCVGQRVVMDFELVAANKIGQGEKISLRAFKPEKSVTK